MTDTPIPEIRETEEEIKLSTDGFKCKINGKAYRVKLTVKKALNDEVRFFYYFKLTEG